MSETVATVKVLPWSSDQGDFVLINEADFDPVKHEAFTEPAEPTEPPPAKPARKPKE